MPKKRASMTSKAPEMEILSDTSCDENSIKEDVKDTSEDPTISALNSLSELLENPQDFLHTILLPLSNGDEDSDNKKTSEQCDALRSTSKVLFSRLEKLASMMESLEDKRKDLEKDEGDDESPLSGLPDLCIGENSDSDDEDEDDAPMAVDAETIWGQVDIQNTALLSKVTNSIRKLSKRTDNTEADGDYQIRLLNMESISDSNQGSESEADDASNTGMGSDEDDDEDSDDEDEDDTEDARRIRERMERSMAEMDDSDDEDADSGDDEDDQSPEVEEEDIIDPSRDEMNDGFFDLHEMEAFADEEEDMLPNEAFGEPEADKEQTIEDRKEELPHIRGRGGNDGEEEDEEFDELETRMESTERRKTYRDDDDINALAMLYEDEAEEDEEDEEDDENDVVNMSAADVFGKPRKPSKEYLNKAKKETTKKSSAVDNDDSDADSWDNHDFESGGDNWRKEKSEEGGEDEEENDEDRDAESTGEEDEESEDENEDDDEEKSAPSEEKLSAYGERTKKMTALTEDLEKEALAEKPWTMLGEASSKKRPENSLLESTPEFEFATKMAPIITQEHTTSIEEMIKLRILAEDWDDVVPRELPDIGFDKRNGELPEVSQEKSKLSLGELYEREYLKKATGYDKDKVEKETEEEKARNEMKMLFANLCSKLDALSNYHFAPRPVADEANVRSSSTPAIAMEEVLPLHVSDANGLAPEEIYGKKKGREAILRGESEMDQVSLSFNSIILLLRQRFS